MWQHDLAISELVLDPPEPADAEYVERFWSLLQTADNFVRREWGLPRRDLRTGRVTESASARRPPLREPDPEPEPLPEPTVVTLLAPSRTPTWVHTHTRCVGCDCLLADYTTGCKNCYSRHYMRLKARRVRTRRAMVLRRSAAASQRVRRVARYRLR